MQSTFNTSNNAALVQPHCMVCHEKMRADIECACDMYVFENLQEEEFTHYGRTIIKLSSLISSSQHNKMLYAYFYEGKDQIERENYFDKHV